MKHRIKALACAAIILAVAGCAAPEKKKESAVFFPPAPDLPRIQYLASFTGSKDIETQSGFDKFVRGEEQKPSLNKPYGVGIYDGKIYVCDTNSTVYVFDFKEKKFYPLEGAKGKGKLMQPLNIGIDEEGNKYVADPVRGQVVVFDRADQYVKAYGLPGNWKPTDAVPYGDAVYVVDELNRVVKVFDKKTGAIVRTIGDKGEADDRLLRPTNAAFDDEGNIYVSDFARFQILKFDRDGHFLKKIGRLGDTWGSFARPRGLTLDRSGNLYAVDASFNNVQIFDKEGRLLMFFGNQPKSTDRGALILPAQVTVDYDNLKYFQQYVDPSFDAQKLIIVTSQFGTRMVNVYAMGMEKDTKYPTNEEIIKKREEEIKAEREKLQKAQKEAEEAAKKAELEKQKKAEKEGEDASKKGTEKADEAGKSPKTETPADAPSGK
jgi:sugar lactone lactonase YvrE